MPSDQLNGTPVLPLMMTVEELAHELQVSDKTVRRLDKQRRIPQPNRIGNQLRWPRQMIVDWLAAGSPTRDEWRWRPPRH
jgi:excisionase family DNA binding protein